MSPAPKQAHVAPMIHTWKQLPFDLKAFYLFLFFAVFVLARVFLETGVFSSTYFLSYYVVLHHFFWFSCVLFWFLACFRYILRLDRDKTIYLMACAPMVHIPLIYTLITGNKMKLAYVRADSVSELLRDIGLLMYGHPKNHPQFYELTALLLLFAVGSYFFSRSLWRTALNVLAGFYGSFVCFGVFWFGVAPRTKAYIKVPTAFKNHQMLALIFFGVSLLLFTATFWKEIRGFWNKTKFLKISKNISIITILFYIVISFISINYFNGVLSLIDYIILFPPLICFCMFFYFLEKNTAPLGFIYFSGLYAAAGMMLTVPTVLGAFNLAM